MYMVDGKSFMDVSYLFKMKNRYIAIKESKVLCATCFLIHSAVKKM